MTAWKKDNMTERKTVHDPIHGSIEIDGLFLQLLDRHEMQRLRFVRQLGMGFMVFPGANHTRFEHSLGVYHLSKRMCNAIDVYESETRMVMAAGMLHDICHAPFSHALEELMEIITGKDHMELARDLIFGKVPTYMERDEDIVGGTDPISDVLENSQISAKDVCDLISFPESDLGKLRVDKKNQSYFSSKDYMHQIIHGPVDADQMDYLMRDAHYTGVKLGTIDLDRLLSQIVKHNDKLVLMRGGIPAAEGLMVSRILMYSSVYFHKTSHMAEMMIAKAVEEAIEEGGEFSEIYLMNDSDLVSELVSHGGKASEMARSVLSRRIYKKSYVVKSAGDACIPELTKYTSYEKRKALEEQIAGRAGVDRSHVIIEVPSKSVLLSKMAIGKTDVPILDGGRVKSLASISPLAKSIQQRKSFDWLLRVSCPEDEKEIVGKAAKCVIGVE